MGLVYFLIDQRDLLILNAASGEKRWRMLRFVQLILQRACSWLKRGRMDLHFCND
jgi:hypothetical protein